MSTLRSESQYIQHNNEGATLKHRRIHKKGGMIHKVRSMESVSFHGLEFKGTWTKPSRETKDFIGNEKASKFSGYASTAQRASLPSTPESNMLHEIPSFNKSYPTRLNNNEINMFQSSSNNNLSHHSLSRPNSVASLTGLDMPEPDEGMTGPIVTLMDILKGGNVRSGALVQLIVLSLLLFVTLNDVASKAMSKSMNQFSQYNEDISDEVLYPTNYKYNTDGKKEPSDRIHFSKSGKSNKGLLGPAMIQSVTEALSPILPFAGGVDLRRDENWKSWNSWLNLWDDNKEDSTSFVNPVTSIPRGGGIGANGGKVDSNLRQESNSRRLTFKTKTTLSTTEPFLPLKDIEEMTLQEIVSLFHYAVSPTIEASVFMKQKFPDHVNTDLLRKAILALDDAIAQSRGKGVVPAATSHDGKNINGPLSASNGYGDIDALKFCAVMRILAEWRVLRQVPPGFKGYSVGMNLGHKDIVQNIVKIESAIHKWIEERAELEANGKGSADIRSPTLREILKYEVDMDVHPNQRLPRLKDKTAAMGLLWVRRQLEYQTAIFKNIIDVPNVYPTTIGAVTAAYSEVYGNLHGWTVQKIFNYSFQSAPDADLIYRHMNPKKLEQVQNSAKNGVVTSETEVQTPERIQDQGEEEEASFESEESKDESTSITQGHNHIVEFFANIGSEWDKLTKHIGDEWEKIGSKIQAEWENIFNREESIPSARINQRGGANFQNSRGSNSNQISDDEVEAYISKEMAADAREHILSYLDVINPILYDLSGLFNEMNMDDPTKV